MYLSTIIVMSVIATYCFVTLPYEVANECFIVLQNSSVERATFRNCCPWSRRSALIGHIGRHQADVGSISGQIGHICRSGRHQADVGRRSALLGHNIGTYLPSILLVTIYTGIDEVSLYVCACLVPPPHPFSTRPSDCNQN